MDTRGRNGGKASSGVRVAAVGILVLSLAGVATLPGTSVAQEPPGPAAAVPVHYEAPIYYFSTGDVTADYTGSTQAEDPTIIDSGTSWTAKDGSVLYGIDSVFGFDVYDFYGAVELERDGNHEEGYAGDVGSATEPAGIVVADVPTDSFKAGYPKGTWLTGLGGNMVKASSEFYVVMEHVLTCAQSVPYDYWATYEYYVEGEPSTAQPTDPDGNPITCEDLSDTLTPSIDTLVPNENSILHDIAVGADYSVTMKDDGKLLYRWGTAVKRPTDIRFRATIPLPEEWKDVPEGSPGYRVLNATLAIDHTITNNSNDQIRPEDWENEAAIGLRPGYTESAGRWVSTRACYEGDGDYIPSGTTLLDPGYADPSAVSEDLQLGHTNAWYTSIDRDPFAWAYEAEDGTVVGSHDPDPSLGELVSGPRWRLTAPKFGQNLPGLEIPKEPCTLPPYEKGELRYEVGTRTTTTLNLLDWDPEVDAWPDQDEYSPFSYSAGWTTPMDEVDELRCVGTTAEGECLTDLGTRLTDDFDLVMYVKGDQKPVYVYSALLSIDYVVDEPYDFGDAPDTYGTLLESDGARHFIAAPNAESTEVALMLGSTIDAEFDGQPTSDASGDVDDGVAFLTPLVPGEDATVEVTHTASTELGESPYLHGWVDFDGSGTFGTDEKVIADPAGDPAGEHFTFDVPADSMAGPTFARFRLTTAAELEPTGVALDGEVEDYAIEIGDMPIVADYEDVVGLVEDGSVVAALSDRTSLSGSATLGTFDRPGMTDLMVGDVTGDGHDDAVAREAATGDWYVLGHSDAWATPPTGGGGGTVNLVDVTLGDVNGDGQADAIGIDESGRLYVGLSSGNGFAAFSGSPDVWQAGVADLLAGDVDGDGDDDVIARLATGEIVVGLSDGTTIAEPATWTTLDTDAGWLHLNVGDVNGDSLADVFLYESRRPKLWAAVSNGSEFAVAQLGTFALGNLTMATVADVNGDGLTDFVGFRVTANGVPESSVALSDGATITTQQWGPAPGLTGALEVAGGEFG